MQKRVLSSALLIVFAASLSFAQPPRGPIHPMDRRPFHEAIIKDLNLTEAQENQMKKLQIELMKKQAQLHSKVQTLRLEIKELFLADKVDRNAVEKNIKAISDLQGQIKVNFVDHWFAVNAILTAEQQKIWKKHAQAMGDGIRRGMQRGMRMMMRERWGDDADEDE
jgi:Spy/CpxP family protein refolding chaperone